MDQDRPLAVRLRELRYAARYLVSTYPTVYLPYARRHYAGTGIQIVGPGTELVIEGFGRSGSTFAVDAFESVQPQPVRIAHHTHAVAQVIAAAEMGTPTLVLVKDPVSAAMSHMDRRGIGARPPLTAWLRYHERLVPLLDRIVVGATAELSTGIGDMIRGVNTRFGTGFAVFEPTERSVAEVFDNIERRNLATYGRRTEFVARPNPEREARKEAHRRAVEVPSLAGMRAKAHGVYRALLPDAEVPPSAGGAGG